MALSSRNAVSLFKTPVSPSKSPLGAGRVDTANAALVTSCQLGDQSLSGLGRVRVQTVIATVGYGFVLYQGIRKYADTCSKVLKIRIGA